MAIRGFMEFFNKDEAPNNHLSPKREDFFSFCDVGTHLIVVYKTHLYSFFDRVMWIKLTALPRCINQERRIHQIQARCRSQAQNDYLNIILRLSFLIDTYQLKLFILILITNHTIESTFDFMKNSYGHCQCRVIFLWNSLRITKTSFILDG